MVMIHMSLDEAKALDSALASPTDVESSKVMHQFRRFNLAPAIQEGEVIAGMRIARGDKKPEAPMRPPIDTIDEADETDEDVS